MTPGYFAAIGSRLLAGRDFATSDVAAVTNVVIVGASMAARFWPGRSPVGELMLVPTQREPGSYRAAALADGGSGVVRDALSEDHRSFASTSTCRPDSPPFVSTISWCARQDPAPRVPSEVPRIARKLDPGVVVGEVAMLREVVERETAPWRFAMRVLTGFGALAAVLAAVGLLGLAR